MNISKSCGFGSRLSRGVVPSVVLLLVLGLIITHASGQFPAVTQGTKVMVENNSINPVSGHHIFPLRPQEREAYIQFGKYEDDQIWHNVAAERLTIAHKWRHSNDNKTYAFLVSTYVLADKANPFVWDNASKSWLVYENGKPIKDPARVNVLINEGKIRLWDKKEGGFASAEVAGEKLLTEVAMVRLVRLRAAPAVSVSTDGSPSYGLELIAKADQEAGNKIYCPSKYTEAVTRFDGSATNLQQHPTGYFTGTLGLVVIDVTGKVLENLGKGSKVSVSAQ